MVNLREAFEFRWIIIDMVTRYTYVCDICPISYSTRYCRMSESSRGGFWQHSACKENIWWSGHWMVDIHSLDQCAIGHIFCLISLSLLLYDIVDGAKECLITLFIDRAIQIDACIFFISDDLIFLDLLAHQDIICHSHWCTHRCVPMVTQWQRHTVHTHTHIDTANWGSSDKAAIMEALLNGSQTERWIIAFVESFRRIENNWRQTHAWAHTQIKRLKIEIIAWKKTHE